MRFTGLVCPAVVLLFPAVGTAQDNSSPENRRESVTTPVPPPLLTLVRGRDLRHIQSSQSWFGVGLPIVWLLRIDRTKSAFVSTRRCG